MNFSTKNLLSFIALLSLLSACNSENKNPNSENLKESKKKVFDTDNLITQSFTINSERDTILKGKSGTVLRIYKNTFIDASGKQLTGNIQLQLKEAYSPEDIILAGLSTTTDGKFLQTGGMLYLNASANGQTLTIAQNKYIGTIVPNQHILKGMRLFDGVLDENGINWKNPKPLLNIPKSLINIKNQSYISDSTNITVSNKKTGEIDAIMDYVDSDTINNNSSRKLVQKKRNSRKKAASPKIEEDSFVKEYNSDNFNTFLEDKNSNYIFSLKKLGWANIDRLFDDPRTKEVEFKLIVSNSKDFNTVYITLIAPNQSLYIPGYKKNDGTYSFTHGDEEAPQLPVGEKVIILATAYKNDTPYFNLTTMEILKKQKIEFSLKSTTSEKLKGILDKEIR